ncbi:autophagy protein atg9 [Saxophila tyrrhenica]|uniref:Autophagy-related protein 9 n=1 Tax=Saxophila tyrrhenica TaxID=1690608 RepID=A0AAV9PBT1_9PEZI|nr:autophagy protein atg9 [Saxophila tyrrhenica]
MMTSRVLSRLLPVAEGDVSVFEGMRSAPHRRTDIESHGRHEDTFHDEDDYPDRIFLEGANDEESDQTQQSPETQPSAQQSPVLERIRPKWLDSRRNRRIDEDDDVPESLILDDKGEGPANRASSRPTDQDPRTRAEAQWKAAQETHGLHADRPRPVSRQYQTRSNTAPAPQADPEVDAMWLYANASNLDAFLLEVYQYYVEHGVWSILLSRAISLMTELFIFSFAMFLTTCIDYSKVPGSRMTSDIVIPKCMKNASWFKNAALFVFIVYWLSRVATHVRGIRRLFQMQRFYLHVLGITDTDIQTVSWIKVVEGLVKVQSSNIATANLTAATKNIVGYKRPQERLNAETVANRLMRQDNYYVALYNKEILDFTLPLPFVGSRQFYSKSLEWCIDFCLTNFIFDERGSIRPFCLDVRNRRALVTALSRRLQFAALTSVLIAPFNILRFCMMYFFRYYTEFTRNPSRLSARSFTPFAEWKIREFNELEHLFQRRLRQAMPFANDYLKQFPKDKQDQFCRFVALVSGAVAAVLGMFSVWDSELFLGFEVTPGRTALFWLTVFVGIFGIAHGALPDENEVHDPVLHLREVLLYTHYMPAHWKGRLHSNEVLSEFSAMYQMKILIFVEEILSLIVAPWILLRNANSRCERIVDFFREQTVHVDGIGHQCNFAVFGFKKDLNVEDPTKTLQRREPDGLRDEYFGCKDDKMEASVQNFMQYYSHAHHAREGKRRGQRGWQPPPAWPPMMGEGDGEEGTAVVKSALSPPAGRGQKAVKPSRSARSPLQQASRSHAAMQRRPPSSQATPSKAEPGMTESRLMAQDSDLQDAIIGGGDSKDVLESDTDNDEGDDVAGKNAGVLGMIYQFSKAQTEKGAGLNI